MNFEEFLFISAPPAIVLASLAAYMLPRRMRVERRARKLLAEHPGAERTTVYLEFKSAKWSEKQRAHDALVADMAAKGWTFLKAGEASPLRTCFSWAGGVNMHFVRL